jgi:release factor glutamine methyltransferase
MKETQGSFEFNGKRFVVHAGVYYPAEDSLLLAKHVALHAQGRVLDVGTGCGLQAVIASSRASEVLGIDISPLAVANARENAALNGARCCFSQGDLFSNVSGQFDTIILNPPYLPTCEEDATAGIIDKAWNGGSDGRALIERFLMEFPGFLAAKGVLLMLHSSLADTQKTLALLRSKGFHAEVLERQRFFFEEICVIMAQRREALRL